jgi:peptide/nickel transport system substrate-binding protein
MWPWLADLEVKKAMEHAIDKQTIVEQVLSGVTKVTNTPISWIVAPFGGDYNTVDQGYTGNWPIEFRGFDPDKARTLLEDAGWTLNGRGVRHKVIDGEDYTIENFDMPYYHFATSWAEAIMAYWQDIGIFVTPVPVDATSFYQKFELGEFGMMDEDMGGPVPITMNTMGGGPEPNQVRVSMESRDEWAPGWLKGVDNFGFYENERVDDLFNMGTNTPVYTERKDIYDEMQYLVHEDMPFIFLFNKWKIEAWNNDFAGFGSNRPIAWYGSYFRGNQSASNLEKGVYWRGGTAEPNPETVITSIITSIATTTQTVPEFMNLRVLAALTIVLLTGIYIHKKRRKEN